MVTDIGQDFDEHDANVCHAALAPLWHQYRQAIEHQLAQADKVFRHVINFGCLWQFRLADLVYFAVDSVFTSAIEGEINLRQLWIKLENMGIWLDLQSVG